MSSITTLITAPFPQKRERALPHVEGGLPANRIWEPGLQLGGHLFLTGLAGVNQLTASEVMRLNTNIPPTSKDKQSALGLFGGDSAGFPNGRRPGDDVVDIALLAAMGRACQVSALALCDPSMYTP